MSTLEMEEMRSLRTPAIFKALRTLLVATFLWKSFGVRRARPRVRTPPCTKSRERSRAQIALLRTQSLSLLGPQPPMSIGGGSAAGHSNSLAPQTAMMPNVIQTIRPITTRVRIKTSRAHSFRRFSITLPCAERMVIMRSTTAMTRHKAASTKSNVGSGSHQAPCRITLALSAAAHRTWITREAGAQNTRSSGAMMKSYPAILSGGIALSGRKGDR
mmetsp:Transcript_21497/g.47691  ORF Transcript_21497/g.47691 Transcript_21497/m.47691 type:complete len:216 (+) Transcript_21497:1607-2254(+)